MKSISLSELFTLLSDSLKDISLKLYSTNKNVSNNKENQQQQEYVAGMKKLFFDLETNFNKSQLETKISFNNFHQTIRQVNNNKSFIYFSILSIY
jgi:5,10-methylene-tetrahydrofolate dehydrogenase/methenyl tetrahydrofolate cyclohydrolase